MISKSIQKQYCARDCRSRRSKESDMTQGTLVLSSVSTDSLYLVPSYQIGVIVHVIMD